MYIQPLNKTTFISCRVYTCCVSYYCSLIAFKLDVSIGGPLQSPTYCRQSSVTIINAVFACDAVIVIVPFRPLYPALYVPAPNAASNPDLSATANDALCGVEMVL